MRHTFCIAEDHWEQASLSARSLTPLAFATTLISHESFDIGSGTRQAPTQKDLVILATEQCAPILVKMRHGLTTSNRPTPKSSCRCGNNSIRTLVLFGFVYWQTAIYVMNKYDILLVEIRI
jgi:hypothetical protein